MCGECFMFVGRVALESCMICAILSRGISIPHNNNCFIPLQLQLLEFPQLYIWKLVCTPCCSATWKRDLGEGCGAGESFFRFLCQSMIMLSCSCFDHEEFHLFVSI